MPNRNESGLKPHVDPLFVLKYKRSRVLLWLFIYAFYVLFFAIIALMPVGHKGEIALPALKILVCGLVSLVMLFQLIDLFLFREIRVYEDRITKVWKWIGVKEIGLASAFLTESVPGGWRARTICPPDTKWYVRGIKGIFYYQDLADPRDIKRLNSLLAYLSRRRIQEFEDTTTTRRLIKDGNGLRSAIGYTFDERLLDEVTDERAFNHKANLATLVVALCLILGMCILWYPFMRALFYSDRHLLLRLSEVRNKRFQFARIPLESIESSEQTVLKIFKGSEEAVVGSPFPSLLPDILGSVELWSILGEEMDLDEVFDFLQPLSESFRLVPRCVVHNQVNLSPFVVAEQLFDERRKCVCIVPLDESEVPTRLFTNSYSSHDLCAPATRKTLYMSSLAYPGPSSVQ